MKAQNFEGNSASKTGEERGEKEKTGTWWETGQRLRWQTDT